MVFEFPKFKDDARAKAPFLPLAFRVGAAFGLMVLQLALPSETAGGAPGEALYLVLLGLLFAEAVWEISRSIRRGGAPFDTPSPAWIRFNIFLDAALVTLLIAFHGVDQERLATIYIFPVLASAFYLRNYEIVAVGILSSAFHIASALLFTSGAIGPFGNSVAAPDLDPSRLTFILSFATLQIFAATLVVVVIRKNLETLSENLSASEAAVDTLATMYRQVFQSMLAGIITVDLDGTITSANPAAEKILKRNLVTGMAIDQQGFEQLAELSEALGEQRFELKLSTPTGENRIVGGNRVPLRGPEAAVTGHLLVFQDLTDIKRLEERTKVSERLATVGELSAEMAHELRNPMASILGCVQILRQGEQAPAIMDRILNILGRESGRVSAIVDDFLDFTRPRPARIQPIWLPAKVEELKASWETDPRSQGLALITSEVPSLTILGDPAWVHQVFTNLLSNARKAVKDRPGAEIQLRFRPWPRVNVVVITVQDNGCGMSEERRRALFVPFASGFEEGTGLGMSLVFQFVQQMGWSIQVESTLGQGTSVALTVPLEP
jgi:two-component system sensor histidine kinase PilS (NtrC family)